MGTILEHTSSACNSLRISGIYRKYDRLAARPGMGQITTTGAPYIAAINGDGLRRFC
jgi:hypothetical protein